MIKLLLLAVVPFMTEHRNVAPKTEVSTNFYGSVTGIVDNAYIKSHGGGGGGGGGDTNAVIDIVHETVEPMIEESIAANEKTGTDQQTVRGGLIDDFWSIKVDEANRASSDIDGNYITETYATKDELNGKLDKTGGTITREEGEPVSLIVSPDLADMTVKFGSFEFTDNDAGDSSTFRVGDFKLETVVYDDGWSGAMKMSLDGEGASISVNGTNVMSELSKKRNSDDNTCHKTEFTEWTLSGDVVEGATYEVFPKGDYDYDYDYEGWIDLFETVGGIRKLVSESPGYTPNILRISFDLSDYDETRTGQSITATRTGPVCVSNDTFVTSSYVTNAVTAATNALAIPVISPTDPTFSNAVLAVGLNIDTDAVIALNGILADTNVVAVIGEIAGWPVDPTSGATTIGSLLAALAAAVYFLKRKTSLLENDGKASNDFATDLMGKPVAKDAIAYKVATDAGENRSVLVVEIAETATAEVNVVVPAPVANKVIDFEVWVKVAARSSDIPQINYGYMVDETFTPVTLIKKGGENPAYEKDASATVTNIVHFTSTDASGYTVVAAAFK